MDAERIYSRLEEAGGFLPFHDKTSPEIIKREFQISKAAFKRAIGRLMKQKKIQISSLEITRAKEINYGRKYVKHIRRTTKKIVSRAIS